MRTSEAEFSELAEGVLGKDLLLVPLLGVRQHLLQCRVHKPMQGVCVFISYLLFKNKNKKFVTPTGTYLAGKVEGHLLDLPLLIGQTHGHCRLILKNHLIQLFN